MADFACNMAVSTRITIVVFIGNVFFDDQRWHCQFFQAFPGEKITKIGANKMTTTYRTPTRWFPIRSAIREFNPLAQQLWVVQWKPVKRTQMMISTLHFYPVLWMMVKYSNVSTYLWNDTLPEWAYLSSQSDTTQNAGIFFDFETQFLPNSMPAFTFAYLTTNSIACGMYVCFRRLCT